MVFLPFLAVNTSKDFSMKNSISVFDFAILASEENGFEMVQINALLANLIL